MTDVSPRSEKECGEGENKSVSSNDDFSSGFDTSSSSNDTTLLGGLTEPHVSHDGELVLVTLDSELEERRSKAPPEKHKLYFLGSSFCCFFSAYGPAQGLITSIFGERGFWAMFTLYVCFTISAFYATVAVKFLGVRLVMVIASVGNVLFIVSCIPSYIWRDSMGWLLYVACGSLGLLCTPFWVAQGVYVSRLTQHHPEVVGQFNGTFLGLLFCSAIIGNVLVSSVSFFFDTLPVLPIFYILSAIAVASAIMFQFLPEPPIPIHQDPSIPDLYKTMWKLAQSKAILCFVLYFFYLGVTVTFTWGKIPLLIQDKRLVPILNIVYGVGLLLASFMLGKVYDMYGFLPLAAGNAFIVVVGYISVAIGYDLTQFWLFVLACFLFGCLESLGNTMSLSSLMLLFPSQASTAFFYFRCFSGLGNAAGFVFGSMLSHTQFMILLGIGCGLSLLLFSFYFFVIKPNEDAAKDLRFTDELVS